MSFKGARNDAQRVRYRQPGVHARCRQPGHAHDTGAGLLLWRAGRPEECPGHHDPELRLHGLDHLPVVGLRLLPGLQRRGGRGHRQLPVRLPARRPARLSHYRQRQHAQCLHHVAAGALHLSDDVRHHHPGSDHRRLRQPDQVSGLSDLPHPLDVLRLLPDRAHGLGQRSVRQVGRAGLCRRDRRAHHRRLRGPGFGALCRQAEVHGQGTPQHPPGRLGHRPALVRLVRLQCRQ